MSFSNEMETENNFDAVSTSEPCGINTVKTIKPLLEICVDNIESAIIASQNGADRIELCQALELGGLTPSIGLIKMVKQLIKIPVFILVRPRAGDFNYSMEEIQVMEEDIKYAISFGVDGFVIGALKYGEIDQYSCKILLDAACGLPVTFHRAFDLTIDKNKALDDVISLGFKRILTSGHAKTALEGQICLKELIEKAGEKIIIMPGSGICVANLDELICNVGAVEYHSSGQYRSDSDLSPESNVVKGATFFPRVSDVEVKLMKTELLLNSTPPRI